MPDSVPAALRERLSYRSVCTWIALVALLFVVLDSSPLRVALSLATAGVLGAADVLTEVYDLRSTVESFAIGVVSLLGGGALYAFDGGFPAGVILLVVGGWFVLDAGQVLRHEGLYVDDRSERDGHVVYQEYVTRRVDSVLRERPRTRRELSDALDADADAIDEALATLDRRGLLSRAGSELSVEADRPQGLARVLDRLGSAGRRLARPVTVEFERESVGE